MELIQYQSELSQPEGRKERSQFGHNTVSVIVPQREYGVRFRPPRPCSTWDHSLTVDLHWAYNCIAGAAAAAACGGLTCRTSIPSTMPLNTIQQPSTRMVTVCSPSSSTEFCLQHGVVFLFIALVTRIVRRVLAHGG